MNKSLLGFLLLMTSSFNVLATQHFEIIDLGRASGNLPAELQQFGDQISDSDILRHLVNNEISLLMPFAINNSNLAVGSRIDISDGIAKAALWDNGIMSFNNDTTLNAILSVALGVDDARNYAGFYYESQDIGPALPQAFIWQDGATAPTYLPNLPSVPAQGRNLWSAATGVAQNGAGNMNVVGVAHNGTDIRAFLWTDQQPSIVTELDPTVSKSYATAVNSSSIVVGKYLNRWDRAFVWDPTNTVATDQITEITFPDIAALEQSNQLSRLMGRYSMISIAKDINNNNQVVGFRLKSEEFYPGRPFLRYVGFMWDMVNPSVDLLEYDRDGATGANAINSSGVIVGWEIVVEEAVVERLGKHAMIWRPSVDNTYTASSLEMELPANSGWELEEAVDIGDDGRIIGWGKRTPTNELHWFMLQPVPGAQISSRAQLGSSNPGGNPGNTVDPEPNPDPTPTRTTADLSPNPSGGGSIGLLEFAALLLLGLVWGIVGFRFRHHH